MKGDCTKDAIDMYTQAGRWEQAHKAGSGLQAPHVSTLPLITHSFLRIPKEMRKKGAQGSLGTSAKALASEQGFESRGTLKCTP